MRLQERIPQANIVLDACEQEDDMPLPSFQFRTSEFFRDGYSLRQIY
jgi:hypothetical protein